MKIEFFIPGRPVPKARPRWSRATQRMYTPAQTDRWENYIKEIAILNRPGAYMTNYAVEVWLTFFMPKPKSAPKRDVAHTRKPDIDNLAKSVLDGLQKGSIFADDGQICQLTIRKYYAHESQQETGVHVMVCYKDGDLIWPKAKKSNKVNAQNVGKR